jgi:DNA polymerase-3 subunit epsilon
VHDTLLTARAAWPGFGSYKPSLLAEHVGVPAPTHQALCDVETTAGCSPVSRGKELAAT